MIDLPFYPVADDVYSTDNSTTYAATKLLFATEDNLDLTFSSSSETGLVNMVVKILLTSKGSVPTKPNEGTNLQALIKHGYNPSTITEDLALIFLDAESQVKSIQERDLTSTLNTLDTLELASVELLDPSSMHVKFSIITAEGNPLTLEFLI